MFYLQCYCVQCPIRGFWSQHASVSVVQECEVNQRNITWSLQSTIPIFMRENESKKDCIDANNAC